MRQAICRGEARREAELALRILRRLLKDVPRPPALRLWNEVEHALFDDGDYPLVVRNPEVLRRLVLRGSPLVLADGYFGGGLDKSASSNRAAWSSTTASRMTRKAGTARLATEFINPLRISR